MYKNQVELKCL